MPARHPLHAPTLLIATVAASSLLLASCGEDDGGGEDAERGRSACARVDDPPVKRTRFERPGRVLREGQRASVDLKTSCGTFTIALDTTKAARTANSFAFLVRRGFYDRTVFHRIAPDFVIQGGDPRGSGERAGTGGPGFQIRDKPPDSTVYRRGIVAMAKGENEPPGTSGSQFFVVTAADAGLPPDYAIVGRVARGLDVVDAISKLGGAGELGESPRRTVLVEDATLRTG